MRLRKIYICLVEFFLSIFFICVGFANWTINSNAIDKANGEFGTYNLINSGDYIYLDKTKGDNGIDTLKYCESGYLKDNNISSTTSLNAYLLINKERCNNLLGNDGNLKIRLTLRYLNNNQSTLNIFYCPDGINESKRSIRFESNNNELIKNYSVSSNETNKINRNYVVELNLNNFSNITTPNNEIEFLISFTLGAEVGEYFRENIYPRLYYDGIKFSLLVEIIDIE